MPAPAIFLLGAAAVSEVLPSPLSIQAVEQIVTVALILILFKGGMHIGWRWLRDSVGPVVTVGVAGTFLTAGALAMVAHLLFGLLLAGGPAVGYCAGAHRPRCRVFRVAHPEIRGRTGVILEGESEANGPVGIALLVSLRTMGNTIGLSALGAVHTTFAEQMAVGAVVGVVEGWLLIQAMRRFPLPSEDLYPLRTLAAAVTLYDAATAAHGSGFLAVFLAGIVVGDVRAPFKAEIERFQPGRDPGLRGAGTDRPDQLAARPAGLADRPGVGCALGPGDPTAAHRPLLLAVRLRAGERLFVMWSGLKGAVPILLGTFILGAGTPENTLVYHVIFTVVTFSVIVQAGLVPPIAARCGVPMREVQPLPWSLGIRFRNRPQGVRRYVIGAKAPARGCAIGDLDLDEHVWISSSSVMANPCRCTPAPSSSLEMRSSR